MRLSAWPTGSSMQLTGTIPPEVAPAQDRAALRVFYNATGGANWADNTAWLSNAPLSAWHGVITDANGRVTSLSLSANGLTGTIPPELENLDQLQVFDIRNTGLCVTAGSELHTWLATINFQGSVCGTRTPPGGGGGGGGGGGSRKTAPSAPRNLEADGGNEQVALSWDAPENDDGFAIKDYEYRINRRNPWISTGPPKPPIHRNHPYGHRSGQRHGLRLRGAGGQRGGQ